MPILCMRCHGNVVEAKREHCGECKADVACGGGPWEVDRAEDLGMRTLGGGPWRTLCIQRECDNEVDVAQALALSNHLGGNTLESRAFSDQFGRITSKNHFGAHVVDGLVRFVEATYWPQILLKKKVPYSLKVPGMEVEPKTYWRWCGVFQTPEKFSRENAQDHLSRSNLPGENQYPALFYVPRELHKRLMQSYVTRQHLFADMLNSLRRQTPHHPTTDIHAHVGALCVSGQGRKLSTLYPEQYMQQLNGYYRCSGNCELVEVPRVQPPDHVVMVCLKIAIACSRPWWVSTDWVHFVRPV